MRSERDLEQKVIAAEEEEAAEAAAAAGGALPGSADADEVRSSTNTFQPAVAPLPRRDGQSQSSNSSCALAEAPERQQVHAGYMRLMQGHETCTPICAVAMWRCLAHSIHRL